MASDPGAQGIHALSSRACKRCGAGYGFSLCTDISCPMQADVVDGAGVAGTRPRGRTHVIVVGNEKGGSGKSTIAMHLIVALMKRGFSVASIDLDACQGTLSRYIENR